MVTLNHESPPREPIMPPSAILQDDDREYVDATTGSIVRMPTPCCGCRTFDHRFPLEMDEETSYVYREAKYCGFSYTFISSWCMMLFFATVASAGIIAIGFLDAELIHYQVIGIALTIVFGITLPVFVVFWVCLQRRSRELRRQYRAQKNRQQVFHQQLPLPLGGDDKDLAKTAEMCPSTGAPASPHTPSVKENVQLL